MKPITTNHMVGVALAIRNLDTGLFFAHGQWTHDPKLAEEFANEESAGNAVREYSIKNADLVTVTGDGRVIAGKPLQVYFLSPVN